MSYNDPQPCRHESRFFTHHEWADVEAFIRSLEDLPDGIHSIGLGSGYHLDIMLKDRPLDPAHGTAAVFFSGAVSQRAEKMPPFLSGANVAKGVRIPLISIADPTLTADQDLGLGWYVGPRGVDVHGAISRALRAMLDVSGNEFWLVGGSGGGFAALRTAQEVGSGCSALVWNPQTSILEYYENPVKKFLSAAYPEISAQLDGPRWKHEAARALRQDGVVHSLPECCRDGLGFDRLIYLQNWNDWHARNHAVPFFRATGMRQLQPGVFGTDDNHLIWITELGKGHTPPPPATVQQLLTSAAYDIRQPRAVVDWHLMSGTFPAHRTSEYLMDLREVKGAVERAITFTYTDGQKITPESSTLDKTFGGLRFRYELVNGGQVLQTKFAPMASTYVVPTEGQVWDHVRVVALDGFNHALFETVFLNQSMATP